MPEESLNKIDEILKWLLKTKDPKDIIYFDVGDPDERKALYEQNKQLFQEIIKSNDNDEMENDNVKYNKDISIPNIIRNVGTTFINNIKQDFYRDLNTYKS